MSEAVSTSPPPIFRDDRFIRWFAPLKPDDGDTAIRASVEARFFRARAARADLDLGGTLPSGRRKAAVREPPRPVCSTLTVWPASLRLDQAAAYCGLSVDTFKDKCPVKPIELTDSSKGHRWLRVRLDEWLLSIDPNVPQSPVARRRIGDRTHGHG
jgi:hypothetical protein